VPDASDISPPPDRDPAAASEPSRSAAPGGSPDAGRARRHRVLVWSLIVVASLLLVVSITANWVQLAALNTDQVGNTTDEILADGDVQQALGIYAVDQLYANVDVAGQIRQQLPDSAKALAFPAAAATRQLAQDAAQRALESPRVQGLVSRAVRRAHEQFVRLIRDEGEFVRTSGGEVTLDYGSVVADLAARLGVNPATISRVQGIVRDSSQQLRQRLTTVQGRIKSVRTGLSQLERGELSPELQQKLQKLEQSAAALQRQIASLEKKITAAQGKVPSPLQGRLAKLEGRLSELDRRLTAAQDRTAAVLKDPRQANVDSLDASLASIQGRVTTLLGRPIVQTPGQLVVMKSSQLDAVQTAVAALRNLGFVLPLLTLLLYLGALYLARGWRRRALIGVGGGIVTATLLLLLVRRLIGGAVVDSLASSATVEPAVRSVWDIVSETLRQRALSLLVIGLAFIGGGLLAGPGRHAVAVRRFLAPYLREQPVAVYAVAAVLFLLWLAFMPGITNLAQIVVIVVLAALVVVGIELLRRQTAREFPPRPDSS
jgi:uncharacterized protein YukE